MRSLFYILSLLALASTTVLASRIPAGHVVDIADNVGVRQLTNAQRFARGMTPATPRRLFSPTRARRDPMPSFTSVPLSGRILAKKADGTSAGYVKINSFSSIMAGHDAASADIFQFNTVRSVTDLLELNIPQTGLKLVPGTTTNRFWFTPTSMYSYLYMTTSARSVPAGGPLQGPDNSRYVETLNWLYDPATKGLSAVWVNTNDAVTRVPLDILWGPTSSSMLFSGDGALYKEKYADTRRDIITFVFEPFVQPA
ncbi:hypothetical protein D9611_011734 [Ephemerocybe angulata]|uniref:Uncharacterized protein n=1 Tax=Ephemerocybe angulata TaxID=980116 RepID=A0A8H5FFJ7_9AGAR|nr:hypothetical protein D9611_011734 [Tulosesus angulatus]